MKTTLELLQQNKLASLSLLLLLSLTACSGSSSSKGGSAKAGNLDTVCSAETVEDFFEAMAGSFDLTANDNFTGGTDDNTFTDGEVYTVTYGDDLTLSIETDDDAGDFTFGSNDDDFIDFYETAKYATLYSNDVRVLTRVDCTEDTPSFFVTIADSDGFDDSTPGEEFFWQLTQEDAE